MRRTALAWLALLPAGQAAVSARAPAAASSTAPALRSSAAPVTGQAAGESRPQDAGAEKLLFGFERGEVARLNPAKVSDSNDGYSVEVWDKIRYLSWAGRRVGTTEGEYALCRQFKEAADPMKGRWFPRSGYPDIQPEPVESYIPYFNGYGGRQAVFGTALFFRAVFSADWSGYQYLRFDARTTMPEAKLRVLLEDEDLEPPIIRVVPIPAGKWATVEVDLAQAVKERGLDLARMANLMILMERSAGGGELLIDNLRLGRKGSKAALPVAADASSLLLPEYYRLNTAPPGPRKLPVQPDRSPLSLEKPFVVDASDVGWHTDSGGNKTFFIALAPIGFVAAFDNNHMLVGFTADGGNVTAARQTRDGGKTWKSFDYPYTRNPDHGSNRGWAVDPQGDCTVFTSRGCVGIAAVPSPRYFCTKATFGGEGWEPRDVHDLGRKHTVGGLDYEGRHCISGGSCVRLADGRLWAAYSNVGRLGYVGVSAKFSDDDSLTWRSWREGRTGTIPGSCDTSRVIHGTYAYMVPRVTPFGEHVAVIWQTWQKEGILWSRFDGKEWSKPEPVAAYPIPFTNERGDVYAVTLGSTDVFLTARSLPGVLRWDGKSWNKEPVDCRPSAVLSVAGKTLLLFSAEPREEGFKLVCFRRGADGKWTGPRMLAEEGRPLSVHREIRGLTAQPYSPPNFVPVAWTCGTKENWIKVLRVPVEE